jgi:hypothetical protein
VIGKELDDPIIVPKNVYNMDETGVFLSVLSSLKILVGKDDLRSYRGAGVKRTLVTAIECLSADARSLFPRIIWPAAIKSPSTFHYYRSYGIPLLQTKNAFAKTVPGQRSLFYMYLGYISPDSDRDAVQLDHNLGRIQCNL